MSCEAGGVRIVNAILDNTGEGNASEGEVSHGILIMRRVERRRSCCDQPLARAVEVGQGSFTWGLWRCTRCERTYSIGPKLPPGVWVSALARTCIELFREYQATLAALKEPRNG